MNDIIGKNIFEKFRNNSCDFVHISIKKHITYSVYRHVDNYVWDDVWKPSWGITLLIKEELKNDA